VVPAAAAAAAAAALLLTAVRLAANQPSYMHAGAVTHCPVMPTTS